ncbi:MAG: two-component sensor histidine kinase [Deltaproteobacteria bacterium]|nr:cache domain-containing protein [Deltaproteobacteria bacterium]RLB28006.1 MAG: two-component sensor histidine kinase [Deltaproteobacteria bacterium]
MFYSTRSKLIASFLGVVFLVGVVSLIIGGQLLYDAVLSEAMNRVRLDLNAAREIYLNRIKSIVCPLSVSSMEPALCSAVKRRDVSGVTPRLETVENRAELDFVGVVTKEGNTLCRIGKGTIHCETADVKNPIAGLVFERMVPVSGTVILSKEFLYAQSPELADRARIRLLPTPRAAPKEEEEETAGMALVAAFPIFDNGMLLGVLYGGVLLNRSTMIVDTVRDTVFQNEIYKGRSIGTATIFFNDLRIATNVVTPEGKRAIGTRVSKEVKEHVLGKGERWTDRAFVVSDWYITAYEPIEDIFGKRVGMLYVGVLEEKYVDIRNKALSILIAITVAGMLLAIGLGYLLADKIMSPVNRLIKASQQVSEGNLIPEIGPLSRDEIGVLQKTFRDMIVSLEERDKRRRAESENRLLQSEKQASIGRLAAGVAHEINNPLTGVLAYTHMLLRRKDLGDDIRSDLETIAESTERVRKIVKGLLDFSRQTKLDREPTEVNRLMRTTISLMENQALVKGVNLKFHPGENLPMVTLDRNQMQSVLLNMIINALDATEPGDTITIYTAAGLSASDSGQRGVEITIADTGCGIPPENLDKLFDPFFSTKEVGQGTGLGLAVSYGIVQGHGGTMRVQSEVGKGTRFFVWLPIETQGE